MAINTNANVLSKKWFANCGWLSVSLIVIILDQFSKFEARDILVAYSPVKILPWLNFTLAFNRGAAFSFLHNQANWVFGLLIVATIFIIGYLVVWLMCTPSNQKTLLAALSLILGGALSNLIDRCYFGRVTDFIDFHLKTWHFATFNLADSAISIGAVLLVILLFLQKEQA